MVAMNEPIAQFPFNKEDYELWSKGADLQTLELMDKIEAYKKSGELLAAIQDRIDSASTKEGKQELYKYLMH
jgi:hypothetical protein